MEETEIDHEYTDNAICPHCGYENTDSWELGDECKYECPDCDKEFIVERIVSVRYYTRKVES